MFGDIFHGTWLTLFAMHMCYSHKAGSQDLVGRARYLLLLMGLFAVFCGFIYNDFSSLDTQLFGAGCYPRADEEPIPGTDDVWAH
jgi:V-type H+-transporting ATPase subunit a|tara:strand:- start:1120 stop:1374 length:255 start_codon:yes stop_codon:yes gene_type:complete